jgi:methionyl-tRNA formyltransferase
LGGINIHASLLPKYRGAAPVAWAIYHGEEATGVSIIRMTPRLDAGGIILQESLAIAIDETAGELEARLATLGARMTLEALDQLEAGTARVLVQDDAKATKAPRLKKEDGAIDWTRSSRAIHDQVRALRPWPCAFTDWHRTGDTSTRLQILATRPVDATAHVVSGRRVGDDPHRLTIACGTGVLEILELKPAGKREMDAAEFLRGNRWQPDDYLGADGRQAVP